MHQDGWGKMGFLFNSHEQRWWKNKHWITSCMATKRCKGNEGELKEEMQGNFLSLVQERWRKLLSIV